MAFFQAESLTPAIFAKFPNLGVLPTLVVDVNFDAASQNPRSPALISWDGCLPCKPWRGEMQASLGREG